VAVGLDKVTRKGKRGGKTRGNRKLTNMGKHNGLLVKAPRKKKERAYQKDRRRGKTGKKEKTNLNREGGGVGGSKQTNAVSFY